MPLEITPSKTGYKNYHNVGSRQDIHPAIIPFGRAGGRHYENDFTKAVYEVLAAKGLTEGTFYTSAPGFCFSRDGEQIVSVRMGEIGDVIFDASSGFPKTELDNLFGMDTNWKYNTMGYEVSVDADVVAKKLGFDKALLTKHADKLANTGNTSQRGL